MQALATLQWLVGVLGVDIDSLAPLVKGPSSRSPIRRLTEACILTLRTLNI